MDVVIIAIVLFAFIGAAIGATKNRAVAGFLYGLLLGPIGWLLIIIGPTVKSQKLRGKWR